MTTTEMEATDVPAAAKKAVTAMNTTATMVGTTTAINVAAVMKAAAAMKATTMANVMAETMCGGGSKFGVNDEGGG